VPADDGGALAPPDRHGGMMRDAQCTFVTQRYLLRRHDNDPARSPSHRSTAVRP
jgi:hypothetical protein